MSLLTLVLSTEMFAKAIVRSFIFACVSFLNESFCEDKNIQ